MSRALTDRQRAVLAAMARTGLPLVFDRGWCSVGARGTKGFVRTSVAVRGELEAAGLITFATGLAPDEWRAPRALTTMGEAVGAMLLAEEEQ